jgi:hypothetical protein
LPHLATCERIDPFFIADLEWLVMTPMLLQQFRLFWRPALGGLSHRAVRRRRRDGEEPQGKGVRGAEDEILGCWPRRVERRACCDSKRAPTMFLAGPKDWKKICSRATLALCAMHVLSIVGFHYQEQLNPVKVGYPEFISELIWLSPIPVLFVFRRTCIAAACYAVPISMIFFARIYYVSLWYFTGVNPMPQKGDWAGWFTTLVGAFSVGVLAIWLGARIALSLAKFVSRLFSELDGSK